MNRRDQMIEIFQDTESWYQENPELVKAVQASIAGTILYSEKDYPPIPKDQESAETVITVAKSRTLEAAAYLQRHNPGKKIAVHNFASATNPGGGVKKGSSAQEESLCRCSTLYPVLNTPQLLEKYYKFHRERNDIRYSDSCIYTPGILMIKSDINFPRRLPESKWISVDVLTCAAPNLRPKPYNEMNPGRGRAVHVSDDELLELHKKRARHMLTIAASQGIDILVLGAFGCGAFQNDPRIVAQAYQEILPEFQGFFLEIEFAVYCTPGHTENYEVFQKMLR